MKQENLSAPSALSVNATNSGKEVTIASGGTLTITLDSNVTTGYSWSESANISNKLVLQQMDQKYVNPTTSAVGAGGQEVWTLQAIESGKSEISLEYRRPFEPTAPPAKTFTVTVVVK